MKIAAKELQKLQDSASSLLAQAETLQQQISDVGGEPLKKKKAAVKQLHEVAYIDSHCPPPALQLTENSSISWHSACLSSRFALE